MAATPRGVRNNNPGNIDRTAKPWQGEDRSAEARAREHRFAVFTSPENGFRAIARTLLTYRSKYGLRTVRGIINRWAPPTENVTTAYVGAVSRALHVEPDTPVDIRDRAVMFHLVKAIARHENGADFWADDVILEGLRRAGISA
jgi:hypothetical protein